MSQTHRAAFPQQYSHPMVGKRVRTKGGLEYVIERVVNTRFGQLAPLPDDHRTAYSISELEVIE